jgi:hypothetical protein
MKPPLPPLESPLGSLAPPPPPPRPFFDRPPRTRITKARVRQKARRATFAFDSNEEGSSFRCRLDGHRASSCVSPRSYAGLTAGSHAFRVDAVDAAGNADATPVASHFSIRPLRRHPQAGG